jgi:polyisoprenoid-binding protein YceI
MLPRLLIAFAFLMPALAGARTWHVDPAASTLTFEASYQGGSFDGRFANFEATIVFDAENLDASSFDVTVDLASVDTSNGDRDSTLTGPDFFATDKFPKAHFRTDSFSRDADGAIGAKGKLTIRGQTQPVTLKVQFDATDDGATLDVDTTLDRKQFGLGASDDWADVGEQVPVHAHLVLKAAG